MAENELPVPAETGMTADEGLENPPALTDESGAGGSSTAISDSLESEDLGGKKKKLGTLKGFFKSGDGMHKVIILGFLVIFVAAIIFTLISLQGPSSSSSVERVLGHYKPQEIGAVLDFLDTEGFHYRLANNDTIIVDAGEYSNIAEQMLRRGIALPQSTDDEGDSILMTDSGFGVSQRMEGERIKHGRELQLARAIERIDGVDHATVLLAIPKENVFAREKNHPSAAVVITLKNNAYLTPENVSSIRYMVASSVHNLMAKDVSVTDQQGRLLSAETKGDTAESRLQREFELRTMREAQYRDKLDTILGPMLGYGRYSAEVDVTLDTTQQEETSQLYNPDSQAVRSETLKEQQGGDDRRNPYGVPGSLSNQPPANAAIPQQLKDGTGGTDSSESNQRKESREAVRNYEVDTTVRHTVRPSNFVQRLTVSVAVDYLRTVDEEGNVQYVPRPQEDLDKIADLVRGGLGLNASRGDFVSVATVNFPHTDDLPRGPIYEQPFFIRIIKIVGAVLVILILVIFIIRPMLNKLLHKETAEEESMDEDLDAESALMGDDDLNVIARTNDLAEQVYSVNKEGGIELPNLHKEADLLKAVRTLVSNEPQLTSEVIKEWLESDAKDKSAQK